MIVSHLLLILHKKIQFYIFMFKPEMWQKVAKFKGAENFRKALYTVYIMLYVFLCGQSLDYMGHLL